MARNRNNMKGNVQRSDANKYEKKMKYSPSKLKKALSYIQSGEETCISKLSKQFNIPRTTLLYKANGIRPRDKCKPGPEPMLGANIELELENWLLCSSKRGFPLTRDGLLYSANMLLQGGHGKPVNTYNEQKGLGRRWFEAFMKRHPILTVRTAEYLHKGRAIINENRIRKWFEEISIDLKDHLDVFKDERRIFNCDETSFFLYPKSRPVIAKKGQRNVYDASTSCNKENMTVLVTGNAKGEIAPPMAVVSFKKIPTDIATAANPQWAIARTPNGWMTCGSFFEYIANIFKSYIDEQNIPTPVILFFDGHSSHLSLQLSKFCQENGIILVTLPPNATHVLQPLDVAVFGPLKNDWKRVLEKFKLTKKIEPRKCHILPILEEIFNDTNFKGNLAKGFKTCGLYPLNPNAVDYSKCLNYDDKSSEKSPSETPADVNLLLKQFEHKIPGSLMNDFKKIGQTGQWSGNEKLCGLFNFYKAIKFDLNFEDLMDDELEPKYDIQGVIPLQVEIEESSSMVPFSPHADLDYLTANEVLDLDVPITYINPDDSILGLVNNVDNACSERKLDLDASITYADLHDGVVSTNLGNKFASLVTNVVDNNICGEVQLDFNASVASIDLGDTLPSVALPDSSAPPIVNEPINGTAPDLQTSVTPTQNRETKTPLSYSSVEEILNSIVRYTEKDSAPGEKNSARKKLNLPSVMTSQGWIDLKAAAEKEKEDIERKKQEKKKRIKLQRKAQLEQKENRNGRLKLAKAKTNPVKAKHGKVKSVDVKPKLVKSKIIENPIEVKIGQWAVIEFKDPNTRCSRRFIGKIFKVAKGKLYGQFVRPQITREYSGFVFKYPQVNDVSKVSFQQIKKLLPTPHKYGRGWLKFCINVKNL